MRLPVHSRVSTLASRQAVGLALLRLDVVEVAS
jgi:hypothetical protein